MMTVGYPAAGTNINFDIARARQFGTKLHDGVAEIGAALAIVVAGMKNSDRPAVQTDELIAQEPLVLPDCLKEPFGGGFGLVAE